MKVNHYDAFAESYTADNESNLLNNYYERPAVLDLVGEVEGRHVLDAGCGAGPLIAALHVADLSQPLPFTAALPAGLGSTAGGAAARPEARRPSHPVGEPPGHLQDLTRAPTTSP